MPAKKTCAQVREGQEGCKPPAARKRALASPTERARPPSHAAGRPLAASATRKPAPAARSTLRPARNP